MKVRILSLLLTFALIFALIPVSASAAGKESTDIEQQIRSTYRTALRRTGKSSFNGYCGSFVNWQTYILGIDDHAYGCDGKDEFDMYRRLGTTTGGYRVKCYPAGQYDLRSALNSITRNGTVDAYNILVGFQRTNTSEGSIYGHAVLIHAILDGEVYFAESYTCSVGGKYWSEGEPIRVSIDTFCNYYNSWTVFDGVAYFGVKSYADLCREYPAGMYAMAKKDLNVYAAPFDLGVSSAEKTGDGLLSGEIVKVTGLFQTPGGAYWYRLDRSGYAEYVTAEDLAFISDCYDDVQASQVKIPTTLNRGAGFVMRGTVASVTSQLLAVEVHVYSAEDEKTPLFSGSVEAAGNAVNLSSGKLDRTLTFRKLEAGTYHIAIQAQVQSYVLEDGAPVLKTKTVEVYRTELQIITRWAQYSVLTFDGNGGQADLAQTAVKYGQPVGSLPTATRPGYILAGWSLDREGTQMVAEDTVLSKHTTLYAQWKPDLNLVSGWQQKNGIWHFYRNGKVLRGWFTSNGLTFYVQKDGSAAWGWEKVDGKDYYFNIFGVMQTGWITTDGNLYYLRDDGSKVTGWMEIDGINCYFSETGKLLRGGKKPQDISSSGDKAAENSITSGVLREPTSALKKEVSFVTYALELK